MARNGPDAASDSNRSPVAAEDESPNYLSHEQILLVMFGLMAGLFLAALDQSIVATALPRIVSELGGLEQLSWVVTAYLLTSTAVTPLWGKISDLYGRRRIFQLCIAIFLIGSALCGLSQNMPQLIAFRALQGIGGGGLFAIVLSIIGAIVPPRERGRYQGYFGAVFGLSSVAGPLLGGWFTDGPGWRWIFYVNLPIGLIAMFIIATVLTVPTPKREHSIDYLGAALIVGAVTMLLLYLNWAGDSYGWGAANALMLPIGAAILTGLFIVAERRATEPILPPSLFANSIFRVGNLYIFLAGMAMFGALIFLPVYFQAVMDMSPTRSGLALLPMVVGIFTTAIGSGQLITRTGRYRIYPIIGASILSVALALFSRLQVETPYWQIAIYAFLFGAGLGFTMQTVVVAVQNSVPIRDMGSATSATTFFRNLGASIGTAIFGAVLGIRLAHHLDEQFAGGPPAAGQAAGLEANNIQAIQALEEPAKRMVLSAYTHALDDVFLTGIPFVVLALIVSFFLKEIPLRTGRAPVESPPAPMAAASSDAQPPRSAPERQERERAPRPQPTGQRHP